MKKNILDRKFNHHIWFKNTNMTRREAIEYFANNYDFYLTKKPSKEKDQPANLFEMKYDYVLCSSERGSWRMSEEEALYYLSRVNEKEKNNYEKE